MKNQHHNFINPFAHNPFAYNPFAHNPFAFNQFAQTGYAHNQFTEQPQVPVNPTGGAVEKIISEIITAITASARTETAMTLAKLSTDKEVTRECSVMASLAADESTAASINANNIANIDGSVYAKVLAGYATVAAQNAVKFAADANRDRKD